MNKFSTGIDTKREKQSKCSSDRESSEWKKFVDKFGIEFDTRDDKTASRSTITILNPPFISVLNRIFEVCRNRYGTLKGDYLLTEYGYNKFYEHIRGLGLIKKYKIVKDIKYGFSTKDEVPIINVSFYEDADKRVSHGKVVLNVTKEQLAKIKKIGDSLGFATTYELGFACVVFSLGDMLGKVCSDSEYMIYCNKYPENLSNKLIEQNDILNLWLFIHLDSMIMKVNGLISYYKTFGKEEYEYGFNSKLFQTVWALNETRHFTKDDKLVGMIKDLNLLIHKYPELISILNEQRDKYCVDVDLNLLDCIT